MLNFLQKGLYWLQQRDAYDAQGLFKHIFVISIMAALVRLAANLLCAFPVLLWYLLFSLIEIICLLLVPLFWTRDWTDWSRVKKTVLTILAIALLCNMLVLSFCLSTL